MIEQFNFDIQLIFAILNGKVSAAINRKLSRNFRLNDMEITVLAVLFLTVRVKLAILSIEKALSAMVSFPSAKESIRMTAQVWESGAVISYCYGSL